MLHSLFVKLAMLAVVMSLVFWIGWQVPVRSSVPAASGDGTTAGGVPLSETEDPGTSRSNQLPARPVSAKFGTPSEAHVRSAVDGRLDLNRADAKEFESLPGIGPVLAQRVIEYRSTVGRFQVIDDLRAVKGIGPKIFERIKPLVTVSAVDAKGKAEKGL